MWATDLTRPTIPARMCGERHIAYNSGRAVLDYGQGLYASEYAICQDNLPNQTTAWSGLDRTIVRWGHLDARQPAGFAFMISRDTAESLRTRLRAGDQIALHAKVKAEVGPGHWTVVSGV